MASDRGSFRGEPLYLALKRELRDYIATNLSPGDRLPSEPQLTAMKKMSRTTVRSALASLANEGLIVRRQGHGTFVAQPRSGLKLGIPVIDDGSTAGSQALRLVSLDAVPADTHIVGSLGLQSGQVCRIRQVAFRGEEPTSYHVSYMPPHMLGQDVWTMSFTQRVASLIAEFTLTPISRVTTTVQSVRCDEFRSQLLGIDVGDPCLLLEATYWFGEQDESERPPTLFERSFYIGSKYQIEMSWTPDHATAAANVDGI